MRAADSEVRTAKAFLSNQTIVGNPAASDINSLAATRRQSAAPTIRVRNLVKQYAKSQARALDDVSFEVPQACIFGLLGPNGAGKTTLVKTLLALHAPTSGTCQVLGRAPGDAETRRRIGYLPEQLKIPEYYKAEPFLREMAALNGYRPAKLDERIQQVLELVGLADARQKRVDEYSKGMRQRLGLAQALLHDPELIILDEPTDGLDPLGRKEIRDLLTVLRFSGKTIFLNSHLLSEIELVCDQLVVLRKGKIARCGAPSDFTRATGEYRIRLTSNADAAKAAACFAGCRCDGSEIVVQPRDVAELNQIIDRIRAVRLLIEAVEAVRATMEDSFLSLVTGEGGA